MQRSIFVVVVISMVALIQISSGMLEKYKCDCSKENEALEEACCRQVNETIFPAEFKDDSCTLISVKEDAFKECCKSVENGEGICKKLESG